MSITNRIRFLGVLCTFFIFSRAFPQSSSSTYSALGLGEFNYAGLTQNQGMGGLGISFGTGWGVNYMNPALTTRNTIFNFQAALNYKRINVTSASDNQTIDGGGISYVALSFPVKSGKRTLGMGLGEISSVNYSILVSGEVTNSDFNSINRVEGEGGISEAYLSYGFVLAKNLSLGIHGSYLFGSTIRTNQLALLNPEEEEFGFQTEYYERLTISDVTFKGGVHYYFKSGSKSNIHLGATYHAFGNINGKEFAKIADFGQASKPDSDGDVLRNNEKGTVFIPSNLGYGISYEKINKFVIGLEAQMQNFSQYRSFSGVQGELGDTYRVALGGQLIPNFSTVNSIFKRSTIRFGVEYQQTPFILNQTQISDIGINFGASVPINSLSLMNFAVKFGSRGTLNNGLIKEEYFGVTLGFSLNDNSWFYKRVFE
ncbi:hypothetical protein [Aquiflexum gelatinilyticum]|uniref:hypothetical protein n=1 Tax=Aquiflexum gelatinilyticum TaxID=2961943 RepID=UPI002168620F|nr:hypothetical protein [Aquiflexum gelatinilyticum]MCS4435546.1 hypothetical protein [Aquiflexum gelatinilyticum]